MSITVPCDSRVTMTATFPLIHRCPFADEVDEGTVEITWTTEGRTLELHALAAWLHGWDEQAISHEEVTAQIARGLAGEPWLPWVGIADVSVTTRWTTAGGEVTCRAVPGQRVVPEGA